jgi:outer membrane murein-binding lipoprotein Lpp
LLKLRRTRRQKEKGIADMRKTSIGLAVAAAVFIGACVGGCQEEQTADVKMSRLISAENRQLKHEIEALKKQIDQQKQQFAQCEQERQTWQYKAEKGLEEQGRKMMSMFTTSQAGLTAENERLKAELAKLKGESAPPAGQEKPQAEENEPGAAQ